MPFASGLGIDFPILRMEILEEVPTKKDLKPMTMVSKIPLHCSKNPKITGSVASIHS